jgi:hypothetical protein
MDHVKVTVSEPDEKQMITISIFHNEKTYTTTIDKRETPRLTECAIKQIVTSLIRYNIGLKRKDASVILERTDLKQEKVRKEGSGRHRSEPSNIPAVERKRQYDREYSRAKYQKLKALKATA